MGTFWATFEKFGLLFISTSGHTADSMISQVYLIFPPFSDRSRQIRIQYHPKISLSLSRPEEIIFYFRRRQSRRHSRDGGK